MPEATERGRLVIVSGPSGVGKGTVIREVMTQSAQPLVMSVSATTRSPRPGEIDGVHYHFLSPELFEQYRRQGDFLECFEVFGNGTWYGTLRSEVENGLARGDWIVLEIDVQGALQVMQQYPEAISFFIRLDSLQTLENRLRGRGTEDEQAVRDRMRRAEHELEFAGKYKHQIINNELENAVREMCDILKCEADSN